MTSSPRSECTFQIPADGSFYYLDNSEQAGCEYVPEELMARDAPLEELHFHAARNTLSHAVCFRVDCIQNVRSFVVTVGCPNYLYGFIFVYVLT